MEPDVVTFDRRLIYRPFLERLSPASRGQDLIVPPNHDPRDPDEPPIHVAFAQTAELSRGSQMALAGGIGSGKTTELQLTLKLLGRHADAINVHLDLAEVTDINAMNQGAILIAIGLQLYDRIQNAGQKRASVRAAYQKLQRLANGKTEWVPEGWEGPEPEEYEITALRTPGLLEPRFPAIERSVIEIREHLMSIADPLLQSGAQVTILLDGLDRLIRPERFFEFVEQDLHALKETNISVIVAAPLLSWFSAKGYLQDYFDKVKHIPAAIADPEQSDFLHQILRRRGAAELMEESEIDSLAHFSGGVLRDLITLARTSAEAAYGEGKDHIGAAHAQSAIRQLGKRYAIGLGKSQQLMLERLSTNQEFPIVNRTARELLVNRQVLEYFHGGREFFAVHPALARVLKDSA